MKARFSIYFFLLFFFYSKAQVPGKNAPGPGLEDKGFMVKAIVLDGDTVPVACLSPVFIYTNRIFKNKKQAEIYWKIKRDVKKVYPYAILAEAKLKEYNVKLAAMPNELEKKVYMKRAEKELKDQFAEDLKKLTINQGRILIKLIDRQTGATSYELVKQLRGTFSAFMWQSIAVLFGSNLKVEYDANGKDRVIEDVIHLVESGEI